MVIVTRVSHSSAFARLRFSFWSHYDVSDLVSRGYLIDHFLLSNRGDNISDPIHLSKNSVD